MTRDAIRHGAHQNSRQPLAPMGAENDYIGFPFLRDVNNL